MRPQFHVAVILVVGVVVAGATYALLVWNLSLRLATGVAISNETGNEAVFSIDTEFRDGRLVVPLGSMATFNIAQGFGTPQSFAVRIMTPNGGLLFEGHVDPGVECWTHFLWDGTKLHRSGKFCH